jgi:hypothetical protein
MKDRDAQTPPTFGGFLNYEMRRRGMSQREFADFCSVSHGFIARHMNHGIKETYGGAPVGDPDLKSLVSIARATGYNVCALIRLVIPDAPLQELDFAPETVALARRISELNPAQRLRADQYLMSLSNSKPGYE